MRGEPTPVGTQRRLQALMRQSWSLDAIARAGGLRGPQLERALANPATITPRLSVDVSAAYDRLWDARPPRATPTERDAGDAAASLARTRGWAPPLAWEDDEIDRPEGQPVAAWQRSARVSIPSAELVEDADFVRTMGGYAEADVSVVAMRLGVSRSRLEKAISRQRSAKSGGHELEVG
jgi:hypothetical protein